MAEIDKYHSKLKSITYLTRKKESLSVTVDSVVSSCKKELNNLNKSK